MQDYPRSLPESAQVGFTVVNQVWAAYSPVKNGVSAAADKAKAGEPTHSAAAAEFDLYKSACRALQVGCGCVVPEADAEGAVKEEFAGVPVEVEWPRVVLSPDLAPTVAELRRRVGGGEASSSSSPPITLAARSVLVLDGPDIEVRGPVEVDGALVVRAVPGARVVIGGMKVKNEGWRWRPLGGEGESAREEDAMRGFVVERRATAEYVFDKAGEYVLPPPAEEEEEEVVVEKEEEEARVLVAA